MYEPLQERISKELLEHSESSMIDTRAKLMAQNQDKESKQKKKNNKLTHNIQNQKNNLQIK